LLSRIVAGRSGSVISRARGPRACGSTPHSDRAPRPRRVSLLRAGTAPVIDSSSNAPGRAPRPRQLIHPGCGRRRTRPHDRSLDSVDGGGSRCRIC
jgi:hypothetical protein